MALLYALLQSNAEKLWANEQERAFQDAKRVLLKFSMLVHFDNKLSVMLSYDAAGVLCVLAHVINNKERPILYVLRTLSTVERNYLQLECGALAIIFGVVRLRQYFPGRHFSFTRTINSCLRCSRRTKRYCRWQLHEYSACFLFLLVINTR